MNSREPMSPERVGRNVAIGVGLLLLLLLAWRCVQTVPAGHVSVATIFGDVVDKPYSQGLHFPVNPFYSFSDFDVREKTHKELISVPAADQQAAEFDISVQYRVVSASAPQVLENTGTAEQAIEVHLIPNLRSLAREKGKTAPRVEDFFSESIQQQMQTALLSDLRSRMQPKGIDVTAVLVRDIRLPQYIIDAIEAKKVREQEAERQKAELERYKTEQQQQVAEAQAAKEAAIEKAEEVRTLTDAEVYKIEQTNQAMGKSPGYLQLQVIEAFKEISKDPAAKIYFINGDSPQPLPLLHLSDELGTQAARGAAAAAVDIEAGSDDRR
ncbi:MAG: SPFH domain-containing protein [Planctomycetota bacterium]